MIDERVYITVDPDRLRVEPIRIWRFDDAPTELQAYSTNGGDEDWLAFVPKDYEDAWLPFLAIPHFGGCDVDEYTTSEDDRIIIGCHA